MVNLNGKLKVGDLVTLDHASEVYRRDRGMGVVTKIIKKKYQASRAEVHFPSFKGLHRKKLIYVLLRDLQIISEGGGSSQTTT